MGPLAGVQLVHEGGHAHDRFIGSTCTDGDVTCIPHHFRGSRYSDAVANGDCRGTLAQNTGRSLPDAGKAVGKRHCYHVRCRAVSGTVLSFELGLLWPGFMAYAGPIIGMPFSLEGFAFFLEAIFLGLYLYGWDRIPKLAHWFAGMMVLLGGTFSGIFVVTANAWMNTPTGFSIVDGKVTNVDPIAAMLNPSSFSQALHMTIAAFLAVGFAVAGIHAYFLRRDPDNLFHRRAFAIALSVGAVFALLQPISGDISAKRVAKYQPIKLAAMEAQWETARGAPLRIGGIPDEDAEETRYAIEIPKALSFLAHFDFNAEIMGLKEVPREDRPPVAVVHFAFQIMVACGIVLITAGIIGGWLAWKHKVYQANAGIFGSSRSVRRSDLLRLKQVGRSRKSDGNRGLSTISCAQQMR